MCKFPCVKYIKTFLSPVWIESGDLVIPIMAIFCTERVLMNNLFKIFALFLVLSIVACDSESSPSSASPSFGTKRYERHLAKGENASMDCYVYSTDERVTFVMDFDLPIYNSSMSMRIETVVGDRVLYTADVSFTGILEEESDSLCISMKTSFEPDNGTVSCESKNVHGHVEYPGVLGSGRLSAVVESVVDSEKERCDGIYDGYRKRLEKVPGAWSGDAVNSPDDIRASACEVNLQDGVVYMNAVFASRSLSVHVTESSGKLYWAETFTGFDEDMLASACESYRGESHIKDVQCSGSTISYLAINEEGRSLEDVAVMMKKTLCPGLLGGSISIEDLWE